MTATATATAVHDEESVNDDLEELCRQVDARTVDRLRLTFDDGTGIDLSPGITEFVVGLIRHAAGGGSVAMTSLPPVLSTTVAASVLGVSRPTLMKLIARGTLASTKVGTHNRLRRDDVLELRAARHTARGRAVHELRRAGENFD